MRKSTLEAMATFSKNGQGSLTITENMVGKGWEVTAARKVLHGYGDHRGNGTAEVCSHVSSTARTVDVSEEGLESCILTAIATAREAVTFYPIGVENIKVLKGDV